MTGKVRAYELHPLCSLFPRMAGAEFEALKADIAANGLSNPIVLSGGMILDGGNRYRACLEVGVTPTFIDFTGTNIVTHVLSANLHRRHLLPSQVAALVATATNWAMAQGVGRPNNGASVAPLSSVAERAEQSGVSTRTQKRADKVAKEDPKLALQVVSGEITLPEAVRQVEAKAKPAEKPSKLAKAKPEPTGITETLQARIAELEAQVEALETRVVLAEDAAEQAVETAKSLQAIADGEEAKRLEELSDKLRRLQSTNNALTNQNADLIREEKKLRALLKKYERQSMKAAA